jgi:hypothetical protein
MQLDNKALISELEDLAIILKPWNDQLVVGGGVALIVYDQILSKSKTGAVGTTDIDFLISRNPIQLGNKKISKVLENNGFEIKYKSTSIPSVQSFTKQVSNIEVEIEFLTDNKSRTKQPVIEIKSLGINAQALSYIEMSLQEAIPVQLGNGEQLLVVRPEAWVFHKGLTFTKRTTENKKYKDLYGIWFVLSQLGATSSAAKLALRKLKFKFPSWSKKYDSNLSAWINDASPKDWDRLIAQDINGKLTKNGFQNTIDCS